jgi:uncharacterized protein (TIGR03435 family)
MADPSKLLLAPAAIVALALAQPEPAKLAFEVASVRQNKSPDPRGMNIQFLPGGRFAASNATVFALVSVAYNLPFRSTRLSGGPDWIRSERYDIEARTEKNAIPPALSARARYEKMRPMLQTLLTERFKMTVRREIKERPVYALIVAKNGPKLQRSKVDEKDCPELDPQNMKDPACHYPVGGQANGIHGKAIDMSDIVQFVEYFSDRPFIDRTSLTGLFDIDTEGWAPLIPRTGPPPGVEPSAEDIAMADPSRPTLQSIFDRLGLKMESQNAPVETFVIEHAERPSGN